MNHPRAQKAPFQYFGGKSQVADEIWARLGHVKHYIEPFCGSAAMLLKAPRIADLEVINDLNYYIANFWRALKCQPNEVFEWQDWPVSHIDLIARHRWLVDPHRTEQLQSQLLDPQWPGDPQIAGWWLWGQCAWIGHGWCEKTIVGDNIPIISSGGQGIHSQNISSKAYSKSSARSSAKEWLIALSTRLRHVRILHGDWKRCTNTNYGDSHNGVVGVVLDPPYKNFESLYGPSNSSSIAEECVAWAKDHAHLRIALCGHAGDYDLPSWEVMPWKRDRLTFGGTETKDLECVWFSPACLGSRQQLLFS